VSSPLMKRAEIRADALSASNSPSCTRSRRVYSSFRSGSGWVRTIVCGFVCGAVADRMSSATDRRLLRDERERLVRVA
jgi:hypothetical protein